LFFTYDIEISFDGSEKPEKKDMNGKVIIFTGASRSIEKSLEVVNRSKNKHNGLFISLYLCSFETIISFSK